MDAERELPASFCTFSSIKQSLLNRCQFSLWHLSAQQHGHNLQKGALNLAEIQHQNRHGNTASHSPDTGLSGINFTT